MAGELVTPGGLRLDRRAVRWTATRSGGPGGQHANTSDTAVELTVELAEADLPAYLLERLSAALGPRLTVRAVDSRSQLRNRELAWERAAERLDLAARPPRPRDATRPSRGAVRARLDDKKRTAQRKASRRPPASD